MRLKVDGYGTIKLKTGEEFEALIRIKRQKVGGRWMRVFQDNLAYIKRLRLRGESYKVLIETMSLSDFDNRIPDTGKVAELLEMKRAGVSRAYRELREKGLILGKEGGYYISPLLAWKGSEEALQVACKKLLSRDVKVHLLPTG